MLIYRASNLALILHPEGTCFYFLMVNYKLSLISNSEVSNSGHLAMIGSVATAHDQPVLTPTVHSRCEDSNVIFHPIAGQTAAV